MRRSTVLLGATIGAGVLYVVGAIVLGTTPDASDNGAAVAAWFRDNGGHVRLWLWLVTVALVLFGVLAAFIRSRLPALYRDIFFIGAIAFVAETAVQGWFWAGMAWHAGQLEPATARTLLDVASFWGPVLTSTTVLMFAPVTIVALRGDAGLPRWLGYLTGVVVIEQSVETITIFGTHGFIAPGGPMNLLLGAGLTLIALGALAVTVALSLPD